MVFLAKKNSRNSGISNMQICPISCARPMRFPCTSRVSLPTFLPFPFEIFKEVSHAFFSGVDVESVRCCGGRSLSGPPLFSAPFSHFSCGGGKVVFLPYLFFFCLLPWRFEFSRGRREEAGCCGKGIDFRCCFPPPFLHFPFLPFRPFGKAGKGEKL